MADYMHVISMDIRRICTCVYVCKSDHMCVIAVLVSVEIVFDCLVLKQLDLHQVSDKLRTVFAVRPTE